MIALCYEDAPSVRPLKLPHFLSRVAAAGAPLGPRVADPRAAAGACLWFTAIDRVLDVPAQDRSRLVVVCEEAGPDPEEAEATRRDLGLPGLVEPQAWRQWQGGLYVAWGLYGDGAVATAAGLAPAGPQGLRPAEGSAALDVVLARFLAALDTAWAAGQRSA